jgi:hypothetical protein
MSYSWTFAQSTFLLAWDWGHARDIIYDAARALAFLQKATFGSTASFSTTQNGRGSTFAP